MPGDTGDGFAGEKNAFQFGSETFRNEDQIIQNTAHIYRTSKPQFLSQYITAVYSSCSSRTAPRQAPARDEQLFMGLTRGVNTARRETAPPAARDVKQRVDKFKAGGSPSGRLLTGRLDSDSSAAGMASCPYFVSRPRGTLVRVSGSPVVLADKYQRLHTSHAAW